MCNESEESNGSIEKAGEEKFVNGKIFVCEKSVRKKIKKNGNEIFR